MRQCKCDCKRGLGGRWVLGTFVSTREGDVTDLRVVHVVVLGVDEGDGGALVDGSLGRGLRGDEALGAAAGPERAVSAVHAVRAAHRAPVPGARVVSVRQPFVCAVRGRYGRFVHNLVHHFHLFGGVGSEAAWHAGQGRVAFVAVCDFVVIRI